MRNRLGRVPLGQCLWWDGSGNNAASGHDSSMPDGHVWQDNNAWPDVDIVFNPHGGFMAISGLRRQISQMTDNDSAHPDRHVVANADQVADRPFQ